MESVQRQTVGDYEHIIVDDGSTDGTPAVVDNHADHCTEYVRLDRSRGAAVARNHGLERASGKYITFLDSDDEYHPERLEITTRALETLPDQVGGVFHPIRKLSDERSWVLETPTGEITLEDMASGNVVSGLPNTMYRAEACEAIGGFDEALAIAEDYDFQVRLLNKFSMVGLEDPLVQTDTTVDGLMDDCRAVRQGLTTFLEKHGELLTAANRAERRKQIGEACLELGDREAARDNFQRAVELHPRIRGTCAREAIGRTHLERNNRRRAIWYLLAAVRRDLLNHRAYALFVATLVPVDGERSVKALKVGRGALRRLPHVDT